LRGNHGSSERGFVKGLPSRVAFEAEPDICNGKADN